MADLQFYDQLLKFQLFQGLSRAELLQLAGQTKFGFMKLQSGQSVVSEGAVCQQLHFLDRGRLRLTTHSDEHSYAFIEEVAAPWFFQPEVLFGISTRYTSTVVTASECHFITLSKDEVLRLLDEFIVFRLNFLNILSTQLQRHGHRAWRRTPRTLRERIVAFLLQHCIYPAGHKEVHILMTQLAQEVNDSRLDVSRELNLMQREGLLVLHRGRIEIPSLERLFM